MRRPRAAAVARALGVGAAELDDIAAGIALERVELMRHDADLVEVARVASSRG